MVTAWQHTLCASDLFLWHKPPKMKWLQTTMTYHFSQVCGLPAADVNWALGQLLATGAQLWLLSEQGRPHTTGAARQLARSLHVSFFTWWTSQGSIHSMSGSI